MSREDTDSKGHIKRFQGRADVYSKYRPTYPRGILRILRKEVGFVREKVVADIGSGTGILSELFLEAGNKVYCVEPNEDMRNAAIEKLRRYASKFISVDGTAEETTLKRGSIDLVTVGQALHWFDLEKARAEFARILRKEGYVSILYNYRREKGKVEEAYGKLIAKFEKDRATVPDVDDAYAASFLNGGKVKKFVMPNSQSLNLQGMMGRLASASYMPLQSDRKWVEIEKEVRKIVDEQGRNGVVTLHYDTTLYLGRVAPGRILPA